MLVVYSRHMTTRWMLALGLAALSPMFGGLPAIAETLGTLKTGVVTTPGSITTTDENGKTTTRPLGAPAASTVPAPVDGNLPAASVASPRIKAGPQPILPPGFQPQATAPQNVAPESIAPQRPTMAFPSGDARTVSEPLRAVTAVPGSTTSGITMGEIGGVDASSAGLIGSNDGGFGTDMWRGTTRANVGQYLAMLPVATPSPVANDLTRRLLLTSATPPEGQVSGASLLAIRLDRLIASGRADLATELGHSTKADTSVPVAITRARAALALADDNAACQELANLPAGNDPAHDEVDAFATELSAYCQISSGNKAAANVTLDLAREEGYDDALFFSLAAEANDGLKLKAPAPKSITSLDARFYALAKRELPEDAGSIVVPAVVKPLALDENNASRVRVEAGERAVLAGLMSGDELAGIYNDVAFKSEEIEGAKAGLFPKTSSLRRALLFQAIAAEVLPTDRAELMKVFLATGEAGHVYLAAVEALKPSLLALRPGPELVSFAPSAVRAYLIADERDHASEWFALMAAGSQPALGREMRELTSVMQISNPAGLSPITNELAAAMADDLKSGVAATQNFAATEAMIYDASGQTLPQNVLEALVNAPRSVGAPEGLLNQLHSAGLRGSVGEVVLLTLVAIGPGGPESADRQAVAQSVSSLRAVHLEGEARRLALEALLGRSHAGRG